MLIKKGSLHRPGIEPGPPAWQASILPLNQRCYDERQRRHVGIRMLGNNSNIANINMTFNSLCIYNNAFVSQRVLQDLYLTI